MFLSNQQGKMTFIIHRNLSRSIFQQLKKKTFSPSIKMLIRLCFSQGIKTLVAVVVLYAILWLPMNVFQLCLNLLCYEETPYQSFCTHATLLKLLYIASHFLTVSNTAINPIIYGFANHRFRVIKKTLIFDNDVENVFGSIQSDIQQIRHRLIRWQRRSPSYFRPRITRTPVPEIEDRPSDRKLKQNLIPLNRQLLDSQKGSSSGAKLARPGTTATTIPKDGMNSPRHLT